MPARSFNEKNSSMQSSRTSGPATEPSDRRSAAIRHAGEKKSTLKSVAVFYGIACGFSWLVWAPVVLGPDGLKVIKLALPPPVFACIATLGPLLACFITFRIETGHWRAVRLLPPTRSQLLWLLFGPLVVLICFFFVFPLLISKGSPGTWHWHFGVLAGIVVPMFNYNLLGGPLFEEFGWRGFLQTRLQTALPPWLAAICVGILWAAWHLPLFLVSWSSAPPLVFAFIMIGLSLWMACAFNASGGALLVAILMHSAFNASSRFIPPFLGNTPTRTYASPELFIGCSFLLVGVIALVLTRGRLFAGSASS